VIAIQDERQLAEIMRRIREYRGLTTAELAAQTYVDRRTVRGRDTGDQGYTLAALMTTARALGYTVALIPLDQAQEAA
jgi:transcriptional regulator with XRE-family HTH domain